jgi:tetratricopeptide (TPR) repeat protein
MAPSTLIYPAIGLACLLTTPTLAYAQSPTLWQAYTGAGAEAERLGQYWKALGLYELAYEQTGSFDIDDTRLMTTHANLGRLQLRLGNLPKAEATYRKILAFLQRRALVPPIPRQMCSTLLSLASIQQAQGNPGDAERLAKEALGLAERFLDGPRIAECLDSLADLYEGQGRAVEAQALRSRAEQLHAAHSGPSAEKVDAGASVLHAVFVFIIAVGSLTVAYIVARVFAETRAHTPQKKGPDPEL